MAYELKDMSGSMFKNNRKEKETHPDMTGEIKIDGAVYWISAWKKADKNGNTFYSFGFKKKDFSEAKAAVTPKDDGIEDTIPW